LNEHVQQLLNKDYEFNAELVTQRSNPEFSIDSKEEIDSAIKFLQDLDQTPSYISDTPKGLSIRSSKIDFMADMKNQLDKEEEIQNIKKSLSPEKVPTQTTNENPDDDLPYYIEKMVDQKGRVYYQNHLDKSTTWKHPITGEIDKNVKRKPKKRDIMSSPPNKHKEFVEKTKGTSKRKRIKKKISIFLISKTEKSGS